MRSSFLVFVFSPRCSKPVYLRKSVVPEESSILCAAFVPHFGLTRTSEVLWQEQSQLYFLDSDQVIPIGVYCVSLKIQLVWLCAVQSNINKILIYVVSPKETEHLNLRASEPAQDACDGGAV
jgi:hypothetical protein